MFASHKGGLNFFLRFSFKTKNKKHCNNNVEKSPRKTANETGKGFGFMALSESHDYNLSLDINKDVLLLR